MNIKTGVKAGASLGDLEAGETRGGWEEQNESHAAEDGAQPWQRSSWCSHRTGDAALHRDKLILIVHVLSPQTREHRRIDTRHGTQGPMSSWSLSCVKSAKTHVLNHRHMSDQGPALRASAVCTKYEQSDTCLSNLLCLWVNYVKLELIKFKVHYFACLLSYCGFCAKFKGILH